MADINVIVVSGNLTRDPEIRYIDGGSKAVCKFTVACNGFKDGDTTYFDCDAWEKTGEVANQYLKKGSAVVVTGRLQIRTYDDKDGNKRKAVSITVRDLKLPPKNQSGGATQSATRDNGFDLGYGSSMEEDSEIPFNEDPREYRAALRAL